MRKVKRLEVVLADDTKKMVIVQELSVSQIEGLLPDIDLQKFESLDGSGIKAELQRFLGNSLIPIVSNLTLDEVRQMYPSDIEGVINAIKEVNKSFFTLMVKLNIVEWAKGILNLWGQRLVVGTASGPPVANSLKQDIPTLPIMGIPTS